VKAARRYRRAVQPSAHLRQGPTLPEQKVRKATAADIGLTHKEVCEARKIRDAELVDPGIVQDRNCSEDEDRRPAPGRRFIHRSAKN
jgi:hypothetical protein